MKIFKILFVASLLAMLSLIACVSAANRTQIEGTDYITEGWVDDDTFQVRTLGAPSRKAKGFVRRRTQSEEAALLSAQKRVVELLVGVKVAGASGSDSGESTGIVLTKELEGVVKGGSIVKKTFDKSDNCELTYRIHADGLKEMASSQAKKSDFRQ